MWTVHFFYVPDNNFCKYIIYFLSINLSNKLVKFLLWISFSRTTLIDHVKTRLIIKDVRSKCYSVLLVLKSTLKVRKNYYYWDRKNLLNRSSQHCFGISLQSRIMEPLGSGNPYSDTMTNVRRSARSGRKKTDKGTRSERIYQLKRTRAGMKANVTKLRNEIQSLMLDYKNTDQVREKYVELNNAMLNFRDVHMKYHAELTDECDVDESKEYYDSEETRVSQLVDKITFWIDVEKRRIEDTIADLASDVSIQPQDSVSNVGLRPQGNSKRLKNKSVASNSSKINSTFGVRSRAALIAEKSTLQRRQAIQMEEYLLESKIEKTRIEQERARLELHHRKEQLRLDAELLEIQTMKSTSSKVADMQIRSDVGITSTRPKLIPSSKGISKSLPVLTELEINENKTSTQLKPKKEEVVPIIKVTLNHDNDSEVNKISESPISPQQPPESLADNNRNIAEQIDLVNASKARVNQFCHSTPKETQRLLNGAVTPTSASMPQEKGSGCPTDRNSITRMRNESNTLNDTTVSYPVADHNEVPVQSVVDRREEQNSQFLELLEQQRLHTNALTLPHTEVPVFTGDPIEYCGFVRAFENLIETKTTSASARLYYLIQFTTGDVQELMRSCLPMEANEGYERARDLLKSKYGQNYKISAAYADRIMKVPQIKAEDGQALQKYAVLLTSCKNTLEQIGCLNTLDNPDTLRKILEKLPFALRQRWRDVADNITEELKRDITIGDVTKFVDKKARAANHPLFGNLSNSASESKNRSTSCTTERKRKPTPFVTTKSSYATHSEQSSSNSTEEKKSQKCLMCNEHHWLSRCKTFREKSLQEKIKFTREKGLCDNCLNAGHVARSCPKESFCKVENCKLGRKHSTFLHPKNDETKSRDNGGSTTSPPQGSASNGCVNSQEPCSSTGAGTATVTGMPIVPVKVKMKDSNFFVETYAFLDPGSNTTFCTERLIGQLGAPGNQASLSLTTMNNENVISNCTVVNLVACDLKEQNAVELPNVYSCERLPVTTKDIPSQADINQWSYLRSIKLPSIESDKVDLLIGNDVPKALEPKQVKQSQDGGPYAIKTVLGWTINGPLGPERKNCTKTPTVNRIDANVLLSEQFRKYCDLEFNDTRIHDDRTMSQEDVKALNVMEDSAKIVDGHYQIALPWRNYPPDLPNNKVDAEHRLKSLKNRLIKDERLHKNYTSFMEDLVKKGHAQKVPEEKVDCKAAPGWYLPHHPVTHPRKPDKTRVVFDCAAKHGTASLNNSLMQGPDLTNSLVGVLTRFRENSIAVMGDVEAMFYQVHVTSEDSDYLRYLWWPGGELNKEPEEYQMKVHLFGGVSSPSCASFALRKTAEDNDTDFSAEAVHTVLRNFYVDDCLKSIDDERKAIQLVDDLRQLLSKGGFRLTKWITNSRRVLDSIPESERSRSVKSLDFESLPVERALGIRWDVQSDTLGFEISVKERPPTRRGILSVVSSIYDPLGFVSPFILQARTVLQDLCRKGLEWDDVISLEDLERWQSWLKELPKLESLKFDRCFKPKDFGEIVTTQLHTFADASHLGYGAVSYLRFVNNEGRKHCAFVTGKARSAPMKQMTIPRLELTAAATATRVSSMILRELDLPVNDVIFWTDSTCVLGYISNQEKRFKTFVANKIALIHETTQPSQWRYVNTQLNVADDASRGLSAEALVNNKRWREGPDFLWKTEDHWPRLPVPSITVDDDDLELKKEAKTFTTHSSNTADTPLDRMIERFSSWFKLKKQVAWTLRYRSKLVCASRRRKEKQEVTLSAERPQPLTTDEIQQAETEILKYVQRRCFADEMSLKKSSKLHKLNTVTINGLLRVGGRLRNAPIEEEIKYPVLLPKKHHLTNLIVRHYHETSGHTGVEHVLSLTRERFWPINARATVKKIVNSCFSCRKRHASPGIQKMSDLPTDRVQPDRPPFTYVGIDCFGPFVVKRGRADVKRYGIVFTCLTIRAIHIEVLHSMDTHSFINSFRRFVARRGLPELVRSDNGTNFVAGNRELREAIDDWNEQKINEFMVQRNIKWIFNPPSASHQGGVWERCIRSIRKILNHLTKEQRLDDENLATLMCEIEAIVNSRPITKVSDDPRDLQPLTPNHLLLLRKGPQLPPGVFTSDEIYSRRRWRQVQHLANTFWRRWIREYLPQLQERQKWFHKTRNLSVDDIVLVVDDRCTRSTWPLGRITEVYKNQQDGCVRSAKVKTASSVLVRPITKLVLLETVESSNA